MELYHYGLLNDEGAFVGERAFTTPVPTHKAHLLRPLVSLEPAPQPWQIVAGHSYDVQPDQVVKVWQYADRSLSEMKHARRDQVDDLLLQKGDQGIEYPEGSGKFLQLRPQDQPKVIAMAVQAQLAIAAGSGWAPDFAWRMRDNSFLPITTPQAMLALAVTAAARVYITRKIAWQHKDAIDALQSAQAVAEYDISAGW